MRQRGVSSFTHLLMSYWFCCVSGNFGFGCLNLTEDLIFANDFQMIYEFFLALIFDVVPTSCSTPQPGCFVFCSIYDTMYSDTTNTMGIILISLSYCRRCPLLLRLYAGLMIMMSSMTMSMITYILSYAMRKMSFRATFVAPLLRLLLPFPSRLPIHNRRLLTVPCFFLKLQFRYFCRSFWF